MQFAGHCWRAKQELASDLFLLSLRHGHIRIGRPATTFIDQLSGDTGCLSQGPPKTDAESQWFDVVEFMHELARPDDDNDVIVTARTTKK